MSFNELLLESTIIQGIVTVIVVGAVVYMLVVGAAVPTELWSLLTLVVGFWFGSKVTQAVRGNVK
jgi:hypothetical protein